MAKHVDLNKVRKANLLYSKMQGVAWAKEKNYEYGHFDACKNCQKAMDSYEKELESLKLNEDEQALVGYDYVDYDVAYEYEGRYR